MATGEFEMDEPRLIARNFGREGGLFPAAALEVFGVTFHQPRFGSARRKRVGAAAAKSPRM